MFKKAFDSVLDEWYIENLRCPRHRLQLSFESDKLVCPGKCEYYIVEGIPVMLLEEHEQTMELVNNSIKRAKNELVDIRAPQLYLESLGISEDEKKLAISLIGKSKIDPAVNVLVGATCGRLYRKAIGHLKTYPIPKLRLAKGDKKRLLDIGCNWGRWSIAAYKKGYEVIGIDPSLGSIMAAKRVNVSLGYNIRYIVADARFLPFADDTYDVVFSYSVLQHLNKKNVEVCLKEISRILKNGGMSYIQMANKYGMVSYYHQLKRKFREPVNFEVRYRSPAELKQQFEEKIGPTTLEVDCFLGLGIQASDIAISPLHYKLVVIIAECLRQVSKVLPVVGYVSDSIYVKSYKIK